MLLLRNELFENLDTVDGVRTALQTAVRLEHSTIPPYLYAYYSLDPENNTQVAGLIRSVVRQEMDHMALAANILNAIDGAPEIDDPAFVPTYPGPLPGGVASQLRVHLAPLSLDVVQDTFMEIEEPEDPLEFPVRAALADAERPKTIGRFYAAIRTAISELGDSIFTGDPARQVTKVLSPGELPAVTGVASAAEVIETIVEEGEGTSHSPLDDQPGGELAHYYRFAEIYYGGVLTPNPDPPPDPKPSDLYFYDKAHQPIEFDPTGVYPLPLDPSTAAYPAGSKARRLCATFNYGYTNLLRVLDATFNGHPDRISVAIGMMDSLREQAMEMVSVPVGDGTNAGPSFEYQPTNP
jgi:rubrerythrin